MWGAFVFSVTTVGSLFSMGKPGLLSLNPGYPLVQFVAVGALMGAWR